MLTPGRTAAVSSSLASFTSRLSDSLNRFGVMMGIGVIGANMALIAGNTIDGVAAGEGDEVRHAYGIFLGSCVAARILGNLVTRVGNAESGGTDFGIFCTMWQDAVSVTNNTVGGGDGSETRPD